MDLTGSSLSIYLPCQCVNDVSSWTDLVNDVLRQRKSKFDPLGWEVFAEALQRRNVPRELIGNASRWDYIRQPVVTPDTVTSTRRRPTESSEDESYITPMIDVPRKKLRKQMRPKASSGDTPLTSKKKKRATTPQRWDMLSI